MKNSIKRLLFAVAVFISAGVAEAEIAIVVHPDSPLASMTVEQVAAIYLGNDARYQPIDLPESEPLHHWFYYKVTDRDAVQIRILRARLIDRMVPPKVARNSIEAVQRVAVNKKAIAYVDRRAVDVSVKVIMTIQNPSLLDDMRAHD